eukprot:5688609-Amphidinium_carterae.1
MNCRDFDMLSCACLSQASCNHVCRLDHFYLQAGQLLKSEGRVMDCFFFWGTAMYSHGLSDSGCARFDRREQRHKRAWRQLHERSCLPTTHRIKHACTTQ